MSFRLKLIYQNNLGSSIQERSYNQFDTSKNWMEQALTGYWNLLRRYGFNKTLRFMYSYYYGKYKESKLDLSKQNIVDVNGYKLLVIPQDKGISLELLKFNIHEPITTRLLSKELRPGMFCFEMGGNIGYYALLESKIVGKNGKVIVVEPSPQNFDYLKKNVELQNSKNIEIFNFACGDKNGEINFFISENSNTCRTIPNNQPLPSKGKVIKVPIKKLDTFLEENPIKKLDFLRTDIEGYELQAFEGAKQTISKFKPAIQIEVHHDFLGPENTRKFLEFLQSENYEIKYFISGNFDTPFVGTMKDVKRYKISQLLDMIDDNSLPGNIMLFLESSKK